MMNLWLGYFPGFKGTDSVLLEGTAESLQALSRRLGAVASSAESPLALHELASVAPLHSTRLFAARSGGDPSLGLTWPCSPATIDRTQSSLEALASKGSGHQYFELEGSDVLLIVSCQEYGESWWRRHG